MLYEVNIESFHGPLDLLLYLVKKSEVDVRDIPISVIATQFLDHLHVIESIDIEWAGDFLVMAATLLEIKSKMLLPVSEETQKDTPDSDPRRELVKQLIEYRKTKESTQILEELAERQQFFVKREPPDDEEGATSPKLRRVELWDLVSAFGRLMRETQSLQPQHIVVDETPQSVFVEMVRDRVLELGRINFRDLFEPPFIRHRLIGLFLALLELIKVNAVVIEQTEVFGPIWILKGEKISLEGIKITEEIAND